MMTLLSFADFMEKIYSDTKTLSMIYIIGSILLFIFIVLLIFSLRKPVKEPTKIIEEPNIDNKENQEEVKENIKEEPVVVQEPIIESVVEENKENSKEEISEKKTSLEDILNIGDKTQTENLVTSEKTEEVKEKVVSNISTEIPDIDTYVDNIVNKTYEKNEQFSSVYVNTSTIKLEKVLDKLNVDEDIKEEIVPENEKVEKKIPENKEENSNKLDSLKAALEQKQNTNLDKLESLKKSLEEKKNSVNDKQDDLKNKLAALKNNNSSKLDDLKNKLNNLKNQ